MAIEFSPTAATNFPTGGHFFLPTGGHEFPHQQIDWFVVCWVSGWTPFAGGRLRER